MNALSELCRGRVCVLLGSIGIQRELAPLRSAVTSTGRAGRIALTPTGAASRRGSPTPRVNARWGSTSTSFSDGLAKTTEREVVLRAESTQRLWALTSFL